MILGAFLTAVGIAVVGAMYFEAGKAFGESFGDKP